MPREQRVAISRAEAAYADKLFTQKSIADAEAMGFVRGIVLARGHSIEQLARVDTDADELVMILPDEPQPVEPEEGTADADP